MIRNKIEFRYGGTALVKACAEKIHRHNDRLRYWQKESDEAERALKASTIEFREFEQTGGKTIQPVIDPTHQQRFNQSQVKMRDHEQKIEEYDRWHRGFKANLAAMFTLDPEDITYFGL